MYLISCWHKNCSITVWQKVQWIGVFRRVISFIQICGITIIADLKRTLQNVLNTEILDARRASMNVLKTKSER